MSSDIRTFFGIVGVIAIASAFLGMGCMALERRVPDWPGAQAVLRRVGYVLIMIAFLTFCNGMGGFLTLVLLTGTPPDRSEAYVFGIPVPVPVTLERIFIGCFALVLDILALLSWFVAVAGTVQLLRGKEPPPIPP